MTRLLVAFIVALALSATLMARSQFAVALERLDCVGQPSSRLLVNDTADWTTYAFDSSFLLVDEDSPQKLYVVQMAPHARLVVCVG